MTIVFAGASRFFTVSIASLEPIRLFAEVAKKCFFVETALVGLTRSRVLVHVLGILLFPS